MGITVNPQVREVILDAALEPGAVNDESNRDLALRYLDQFVLPILRVMTEARLAEQYASSHYATIRLATGEWEHLTIERLRDGVEAVLRGLDVAVTFGVDHHRWGPTLGGELWCEEGSGTAFGMGANVALIGEYDDQQWWHDRLTALSRAIPLGSARLGPGACSFQTRPAGRTFPMLWETLLNERTMEDLGGPEHLLAFPGTSIIPLGGCSADAVILRVADTWDCDWARIQSLVSWINRCQST